MCLGLHYHFVQQTIHPKWEGVDKFFDEGGLVFDRNCRFVNWNLLNKISLNDPHLIPEVWTKAGPEQVIGFFYSGHPIHQRMMSYIDPKQMPRPVQIANMIR